jgi:Tol biopolymer transport system component/DNA-binding winged helix-turn-helix (wHTH) protein
MGDRAVRVPDVGFAGLPGEEMNTRRFGVFEVDLRAGELRRGGLKVKLQEQPFQVLALLLERPGEVVSREELRNRLWPADMFVDFDHSLNAAIKRLRDALGDVAENPRFVETVARRGYRFVAPVSGAPAVPDVSLAASPVHHSVKTWWIASGAAVLLIAGVGLGLVLGRRPAPVPSTTTERRLTANPAEVPVLGGVISPDGKYLAFADKTGFYLRQVETGETHPVPLPDGFNATPLTWFPDGSHIVVGWVAGPKEDQSLWEVSVIGGAPRKLTDYGFHPAVSPDGTQIVFLRGEEGQEELWRMQSDGGQPRKEIGEPGYIYGSVVWSPDGQQLAYVRAKFRPTYSRMEGSVELHDMASGKSEVLFTDMRLGTALAWNPRGRLIYSVGEPPPNQNDSNLWWVQLDARSHPTGPPTRLTSESGFAGALSITADGSRLSFLKQTLQPDVYVAELAASGNRLSSPPRRLTLDEREDFPYTWTPDNKSVIFASDRDGDFHIFKQGADQSTPDLLIGGNEQVSLPRLTPDSASILYLITPKVGEPARNSRLMRVPLAGGPPQFVLGAPNVTNHQCARLPSTMCLFSEMDESSERFFSFDPVKGEPKELVKARIESHNYFDFNWSLSPDGRTLATARRTAIEGDLGIRLLSLNDYTERTIRMSGWSGIACFDWAANGKSFWVSVYTNAGKRSLLNVDLRGNAKPVLEENKMRLGWAIPSPDGRRLALWEASGTSNVWMLEHF